MAIRRRRKFSTLILVIILSSPLVWLMWSIARTMPQLPPDIFSLENNSPLEIMNHYQIPAHRSPPDRFPPNMLPPDRLPPENLFRGGAGYSHQQNDNNPTITKSAVVQITEILENDLRWFGIRVESSLSGDASTTQKTCPQMLSYEPLVELINTGDNEWKNVTTNGFVFSAFYDYRIDAVVMIGLNYGPIRCRLYYRAEGSNQPDGEEVDFTVKIKPTDFSDSDVTKVRHNVVPESHGTRYSATFHTCHVTRKGQIPFAVSLVRLPCDQPNNVLPVLSPFRDNNNNDDNNNDNNDNNSDNNLGDGNDDHDAEVKGNDNGDNNNLDINNINGEHEGNHNNYDAKNQDNENHDIDTKSFGENNNNNVNENKVNDHHAGDNDKKQSVLHHKVGRFPKPEVNFTVCVTPLHFNYNNVHQLIEMIEVNRMFGADRFVFYNYSSGSDVTAVLRFYEKEGVVKIIPWHLPMAVDVWPPVEGHIPEIHYFGQLAALNDCLYRNLGISRFIVFTDLDEILVPRRHKSWGQMLDDIIRIFWRSTQGQSLPGVFIVRNTFFRNDWPSTADNQLTPSELERAQQNRLLTLLTTEREKQIYPWNFRSKNIVWTPVTSMVGIHTVYEYIDTEGYRVVPINVRTKDALLHHYRPEMWPDNPVDPPKRHTDKKMLDFRATILDRVENVRKRLLF